MRVVLIGGGIVGVTTAAFLARDSTEVEEVIICERDHVGAGSTARAVGGIRGQFTTKDNIKMARYALDYWRTFEATYDTDIQFKQAGYLFLTTGDNNTDEINDRVVKQNQNGVESELVRPEDLSEYLPRLRAERYTAGIYTPNDARADPHLAVQTMGEIAKDEGVDILTGCEVTDVELNSGSVAVETTDGRIECDYIVNSAGPWAAEVNAMAGVELPLTPQRRQVAVVEPEHPIADDAPLTADLNNGVYFVPETGDDVLVGGHFSQEEEHPLNHGYPSTYDNQWAIEALERAETVASYFGPETKLKNGWSGLYAVTPDHNPIIEESKPGFVNSIGFSGHGFMHAPATARLVRSLIEGTDPGFIESEAFNSRRFEKETRSPEQNVI